MNCYNGESYLNESIKSAISQTYKNWELIFWDNRSKDKRFRYFYSSEHTSLYKARNLAIEKCRGDFIAFLDVDDLWSKEKLELQMPYFDNPEVGVVFSNLWMLKKNIQARYVWKYILSLDTTEQKLKENINHKLIFGITKKL